MNRTLLIEERRSVSWVGVGVSAFALVLFALPYLGDPAIVDETAFLSSIETLAAEGRPAFYAGDPVGWQHGLWHPPTYIAYIAAWFIVFEPATSVARAATLLFTVSTVPLVAQLARTLSTDRTSSNLLQRQATPVIASVFYVTLPLVVQNAVLIDIDGSILAFLVTGFVLWVVARVGETGASPRLGRRTLVGIAAWFAVIAWVKFGALPVLLGSIVLYIGFTRRYYEGIRVGIAGVFGFILFIGSWYVVAQALGWSFETPFRHNFLMVIDSGGQTVRLSKRILLSAWSFFLEVLWLTPFLLILAALTIRGEVPLKDSFSDFVSKRANLLFVLAIALLTVLQYAILAKTPYGFPKYLGITSPLLSALAATVATPTLVRHLSLRTIVTGTLLIGSFAVGTILVGDPFLVSFNDGYDVVIRQTAITVSALGLFVALSAAILAKLFRSLTGRDLLVIVLVVALLGTNLGILAIQSTSDYSTRYFYGEEGTEGAIDATLEIYAALPPEQQASSVLPRDFAYYADGPFQISTEYSVSQLNREHPALVVVRIRKYYAVRSPLNDALRDHERYSGETYGSFVVYTRTGVDD